MLLNAFTFLVSIIYSILVSNFLTMLTLFYNHSFIHLGFMTRFSRHQLIFSFYSRFPISFFTFPFFPVSHIFFILQWIWFCLMDVDFQYQHMSYINQANNSDIMIYEMIE